MSSKLVAQKLGRSRLFFDKFEYSLYFIFPELSALRGMTHTYIDKCLDTRTWSRQINYGGVWSNRLHRSITPQIRANCHDLRDWFANLTTEYKLTISSDYGYFYCNDLNVVDQLAALDFCKPYKLIHCIIDRLPNTIKLKKTDYTWRTYFKNQRLSNDERQKLQNFLLNQKEIRLGPGLTQWIEKFPNNNWVCNNYFIDYRDKTFLTMLRLATATQVSKTYELITDK